MAQLIEDFGHGVEIWRIDDEYYVFGVLSDPRVCPSESMAQDVVAAALTVP